MKRRIVLLLIWLMCTQPMAWPATAAEAREETKIVITVSVGGVACGAYFFLRIMFKSSMGMEPNRNHSALFNRDDEGWTVGFPLIYGIENNVGDRPFSLNVPQTLHMNVLEMRF